MPVVCDSDAELNVMLNEKDNYIGTKFSANLSLSLFKLGINIIKP